LLKENIQIFCRQPATVTEKELIAAATDILPESTKICSVGYDKVTERHVYKLGVDMEFAGSS